jgi:1,4-alpha-glucan branching enzyme
MPASQLNINANTPMGATLVDGGATFRTWAPNASAVDVLLEFNNFTVRDDAALVPVGNGHWCGFVAGVTDGQKYKFWIAGPDGPGYKRDPYAREVQDAVWDCIVRRPTFPWHETGFVTPQFSDFVIYQLHVGAFYLPQYPPSTGTFLDVVDRISYLADLGVTVLQLLPIQEFPGDFSLGYNGIDYFSAESAYAVGDDRLDDYLARANQLLDAKGLPRYARNDLRGEMNQLKALVDLCHVYGVAVIFDLVYNHAGGGFGAESLWFYDRQKGSADSPPQYWNSLFFSDRTWAGGNVFNFQGDGVRQFLINNANFFLEEYRVDGFRYDEVSVIDSNGYGRGWDFCQALTGTLRTTRPGAIQHAEYWPVNPWVVKETSDGGAGFHTTMTDGLRIALRNVLQSAANVNDDALPITALGQQLAPTYFQNLWRGVQGIENHDLVMRPKSPDDHGRMDRIARVADPSNARSWWARSRSRVATGLVLTAPGIPMLFMGQEILEDKQWSDDVSGHPELLIYWAGLSAADPSMRDFLRFTRELIRLRWQQPALRGEGFRLFHVHDQNRTLAFHRWVPGEGRDIVVVVNLANYNKYGYRIGFPARGLWREVFNSDVYDNWVNPQVAGNGGAVVADDVPLHDFAFSAPLAIPANGLLVFAR